jgi:hypothetical protein
MKRCGKCGLDKDESEFGIRKQSKWTYLDSRCKSCAAENTRRWRENNPTYSKEYMREYKSKNYESMVARMKLKKLEIQAWKQARGCAVCGESEPWVLEMHHLDPNEKERSPAASATLKTFLKEASKCVLLCANCHRKVHAGVLQIEASTIKAFHDTF